jgi:hypothetical protein
LPVLVYAAVSAETEKAVETFVRRVHAEASRGRAGRKRIGRMAHRVRRRTVDEMSATDRKARNLMITMRLTVYRYGLLAALVLSAGAGRKWG